MKSIFRNLTKFSLLTATILGSTFFAAFPGLALPEEEVLQKLDPVPVFSLTNDEGTPLLFQVTDNPKAARMRVFVSQQDAQTFMEELKKENPEVGNDFDNVTPISLGKIYQIAMTSKEEENPIFFSFQPQQNEVNSAVTIIKAENPEVKDWRGVPLFFAIVTKEGKEAYLPTDKGKIPLFFEKATLQKQIDELKQSQPDIAPLVQIKVVRLEDMMSVFHSEDDNSLRNMVLVPSEESLRFIESLKPSNPETQPSN